MIKYFHELSEEEFNTLSKNYPTIPDFIKDYPQPTWCNYPEAIDRLGCWSLIGFMVTGEDYCKNCDLSESYEGSMQKEVD